ncbi:Hypothetical predicted protein [Octopus vulgaris]|uniref:Uncharacterized protein n=1 Tax=Octopus vulgaris TaxID=6645 RepID=A0AA36BJ39_OCTVU|nr:Hypothetical predicted protein [Octopus vulgaris]
MCAMEAPCMLSNMSIEVTSHKEKIPVIHRRDKAQAIPGSLDLTLKCCNQTKYVPSLPFSSLLTICQGDL